MEEDHALKLIAFEDRPTTSKDMLHFIIAIPGELDGGLAVSFGEPAVHLAVDATELELTGIAALEFDERLEFLDRFLHVPCSHGDDVPAALDG
jgi:hypothetical protein